jgi:hypothetical protein
VLLVALLFASVCGLASLVVRLRSALGEVRQQIKWLGFGVGLLLAVFITQAVIDDRLGGRIALLDVVGFLAVPITAGIAILVSPLRDRSGGIPDGLIRGGGGDPVGSSRGAGAGTFLDLAVGAGRGALTAKFRCGGGLAAVGSVGVGSHSSATEGRP